MLVNDALTITISTLPIVINIYSPLDKLLLDMIMLLITIALIFAWGAAVWFALHHEL